MRATGSISLTTEEGLALLDAAVQSGQPFLVPARFDAVALGRRGPELPPVLRELAAGTGRRAAAAAPSATPEPGSDTPPVVAELAGLPEAQRQRRLLEVVSAQAAATLGHDSAQAIDADRPFQDLGF
ncbi:acyl carrier protein, partial [Nonomuraea fastidiosa]